MSVPFCEGHRHYRTALSSQALLTNGGDVTPSLGGQVVLNLPFSEKWASKSFYSPALQIAKARANLIRKITERDPSCTPTI